MKTYTAADFQNWGAQGGAKSKRVLTAAQAKAMVAAREKKRRKTNLESESLKLQTGHDPTPRLDKPNARQRSPASRPRLANPRTTC